MTYFTIAVGQTKTFTASWNQMNSDTDQQVAAGTYRMDAWILANSVNSTVFSHQEAQTQLAANPVDITIE